MFIFFLNKTYQYICDELMACVKQKNYSTDTNSQQHRTPGVSC